jgi:hypothetical protein
VNPNDPYQCNIGRMLNSGANDATHNTAGWTNFTQPCVTANPSNLRPLICANGNPGFMEYGEGMGTVGGVQTNVLEDIKQCWLQNIDSNNDGQPDNMWPIMLPVVDCPGNNVSNCAELVGAVTVNVVWVEIQGNKYADAPKSFDAVGWPGSDLSTPIEDLAPFFVGTGPSDNFPFPWPTGTPTNPDGSKPNPSMGEVYNLDTEDAGRVRWASFVKQFNMRNADGNFATFAQKSLYFMPDCSPHEPVGLSQGENFGVLAKIPVLVD